MENVPTSEISEQFLSGMRSRMAVSYHKYGPIAAAYPDIVSALDSLQQRLEEYRRTGNTEFLIDAANFAMIEFMHPSLDGAYYEPTDADASPGRIGTDGRAYRWDNDGEDL